MDHCWDYVRASAFIFFLSFKPSEPYLTKYLTSVKGFSKDQVNNEVYPVYTYTSFAVLVLLVGAKLAGLGSARHLRVLGDKWLVVLGAFGRLFTRLLILFGTTIPLMQLMQVTYALGTVSEIVFYAYVLKVVPPKEAQRLTAFTQASYLVAHTAAGLLGDFLISLGVGIPVLVWISAISVFLATVTACCFRHVDPDVPLVVERPFALLKDVYLMESFAAICCWWSLSYGVVMIVYGYEASLYDAYLGDRADLNGSIFAVGLLAGAATAMALSCDAVAGRTVRAPVATVVVAGCFVAGTAASMGLWPQRTWCVAVSFAVFFMAWSFANTFYYGEVRRIVDAAVGIAPGGAELQGGASAGAWEESERSEGLAMRLVTVVVVVNSLVGSLVQTLLTAVLFSWLNVEVASTFQVLAIVQVACTGAALLVALWSTARSRTVARRLCSERTDLAVPLAGSSVHHTVLPWQ